MKEDIFNRAEKYLFDLGYIIDPVLYNMIDRETGEIVLENITPMQVVQGVALIKDKE